MSVSLNQLKQLSLGSLENCESLVKEATLLHENKFFARSIFLTLTAMEELGKHIMCAAALSHTHEGTFNPKKFVRRFRSHSEKHLNYQMWRSVMSVEFQELELEAFKKYEEALNLRADLAKLTRDRCLYLGYEQGMVLNPADFDEELSTVLLTDFKNLLKYLDSGTFIEAIKNFKLNSTN